MTEQPENLAETRAHAARARRKPEIMSPAGYWPQLHAAVEAGADAVYFGLHHFTARAKVGFGLDELPDVMRTLHRRGVKGYVTFNTLVFDHELHAAAESLAQIAAAGADSIIVQDIGVAQLARQIAPELAIHGSTQMSITSAEGVELARRFGVSRVVLARELALDDIRAIRRQTDMELEIFVHGALCVSYSGQCFSSEAWGGRSANRGQCAQACRLPYDLLVDDVVRPLADARYLLSPGDLYALRQIPEIVEMGISALKIEGRYKDANYVALTTAAYRAAVDDAWQGSPQPPTAQLETQLEQVYSRGLGPWFMGGTNHQTVVNGRAPRHRGVLIGQVIEVGRNARNPETGRKAGGREYVVVAPSAAHAIAPLKPGDGVVFDAADWRSPEQPEEGGRLYTVRAEGRNRLQLAFGNGELDYSRIRVGDRLWRSDDPELDKVARPYTHANGPVAQQPLVAAVVARVGEPLVLTLTVVDAPEFSARVASDEPLVVAGQRPLDREQLWTQLARLGNTPYVLAELDAQIEGAPFVPVSLLNQLRRAAVEALATQQGTLPPVTVRDTDAALSALVQATRHPQPAGAGADMPDSGVPHVHLLVRTPAQLEAALALRPASITLDYLDLYGLRPAVDAVKAAGIEVRVASPRVLKPNEQRIVNFLLRLDCPLVIRASGLLHALQAVEHPPLIGDFSLNAANQLSAATLLQLGLARLTPTHDLNAAQVTELARLVGPTRLEVIGYQHLPVFHTEHCVFCRFLSTGTSYKDCGHPCETHKVALRDQHGRAHPVMADVGCRNTVFGAEAQEASAHLPGWLAAGIRHIRLEFVHESGEEVTAITHAFAQALADPASLPDLPAQLRALAPQGTTEGSLFVPHGYQAIPLMV
ncbi:MAG: DUF3656 domain-containing protein [Litorilinea sp.]